MWWGGGLNPSPSLNPSLLDLVGLGCLLGSGDYDLNLCLTITKLQSLHAFTQVNPYLIHFESQH